MLCSPYGIETAAAVRRAIRKSGTVFVSVAYTEDDTAYVRVSKAVALELYDSPQQHTPMYLAHTRDNDSGGFDVYLG